MPIDCIMVAAVIVSYFPEKQLLELVQDLDKQVEHIIIVDNGSQESLILKEIERMNYNKVGIIYLQENKGIAAGLNCGILELENRGYQYVVTFDQDSRIPENYITCMLDFIHKRNMEQVGLIAPNFIDVNSNTAAKFAKLTRFSMDFQTCDQKCEFFDTTFAISSGALIPIHIFKKIGFFQEDLFIDHVDSEFCLRLAKYRYKTLINCKLTMFHSIGKRQKRKFLGLTFKPNNHQPVRRYYISRNGIYLCGKYFREFPSFLILNTLRMIHEIFCIILYEKQKTEKMSMIIRGLSDGLKGHMGVYFR